MTFARRFMELRFPVSIDEKMLEFTRLAAGLDPERRARLTQRIKSNTTVLAFNYNDGAIIAADRRTTAGWDIVSDASIKIKQLTSFSAIGSAGYCHVIDWLEEEMESTCRSFVSQHKRELSPDALANRMKRLLFAWWFFDVMYWTEDIALPILATYDRFLAKPRIFHFSLTGFYMEPEDPPLAGVGCGYEALKGLLGDSWRRGIGLDSAINLTIRAMIQAGILSAGVSDSRITLPTIAVIDKDGFKWLKQDVILKERDKVLRERGGI